MSATYQDQILTERKSQHLTIFSQCFSPCGNHLAVSNNYGTVLVYNLTAALSPNANENHWKPSFSFHVSGGPVYSIISTELFLICAGTGDIKAYKWTDILQKNSKVAWTLSIPSADNQFSAPETNSIVHNTKVLENVEIKGTLEKLEDGPASLQDIDHAVVEPVDENYEAVNCLEDFTHPFLERVVDEDEAFIECKVEPSTILEDSGTVEVVEFREDTSDEDILKVKHSDDVDELVKESMMRKRRVEMEENDGTQKKAKIQIKKELNNFIPSMDDIIEFLRDDRGVEEENLNKLQEEKIDCFSFLQMDDSLMKEYIPRFADRRAAVAFCEKQCKGTSNEQEQSSLLDFEKLKKNLGIIERKSLNQEQPARFLKLKGNLNAMKKDRRIALGWMDFDFAQNCFKQVRSQNGGGTRSLRVNKSHGANELIELSKELFFPEGNSKKGCLEEFEMTIQDFRGSEVGKLTVGELYNNSSVKMLRLYLCTIRKYRKEQLGSCSHESSVSNQMFD